MDGTVSLVFVEDHPALTAGLEAIVGADPAYEVVGTAASLAAARSLIGEAQPAVALVDIVLPDGSGVDLVDFAAEASPSTRVVLYTGHTEGELLEAALQSDVPGIVLKEGAPTELLEAVRIVAAGGTYFDPRLARLLQADRQGPPKRLRDREREVLELLASGLTGQQIAGQLFISPDTVRTHVRNAMERLDARTRTHAVAIALREGEIRVGAQPESE